MLLLALVTLVPVVGLQSVGLILIIAFLITPAAAARFWTENLKKMLLLSALIGAFSGWIGASVSALLPRLPAGAVIVLAVAGLFGLSMFFGNARGVLHKVVDHARLKRKIGRQHLLRAVYEIEESLSGHSGHAANIAVPLALLSKKRRWFSKQLRGLIRQAEREDHVETCDGRTLCLSESGYGEASRIPRNHRLWEIFLITHADIAASHVDRDADSVEHVLSPDMVRELEQKLDLMATPSSPHPIEQAGNLQ